MHPSTIRALIRHACKQCRATPLARGGIFVEFVEGLPHIADAEYLGGNRGHIRICKEYWDDLSRADQVEIVIHETCHIIHDFKYPDNEDPHHGRRWRLLMKVAGISSPRAEIP